MKKTVYVNVTYFNKLCADVFDENDILIEKIYGDLSILNYIKNIVGHNEIFIGYNADDIQYAISEKLNLAVSKKIFGEKKFSFFLDTLRVIYVNRSNFKENKDSMNMLISFINNCSKRRKNKDKSIIRKKKIYRKLTALALVNQIIFLGAYTIKSDILEKLSVDNNDFDKYISSSYDNSNSSDMSSYSNFGDYNLKNDTIIESAEVNDDITIDDYSLEDDEEYQILPDDNGFILNQNETSEMIEPFSNFLSYISEKNSLDDTNKNKEDDINDFVMENTYDIFDETVLVNPNTDESIFKDTNSSQYTYYNGISTELNSLIGSATTYTINHIKSFVSSYYGQKVVDACIKYDCDLATVLSMGQTEFSLSSSNFYRNLNGTLVFNAFQFDTIDGKVFFQGTDLEIARNTSTITNPETHFYVAVAYIKTLMTKYNNNPNLYAAAYNMGEGTSDLVISKLMDTYSMTYIEVINCMDYEIFIKEYKLIYQSPQTYALTCSQEVKDAHKSTLNYYAKWQYSTYGDGNYLNKFYTYYLPEYGNLFDKYNVVDNNFNDVYSR